MRDGRSSTQSNALEEAPLYVRWNPERSRYAIELRLDLVARLEMEIRFSHRSTGEFGGLLLGSRVAGPTPILRIEDFQLVPGAPSDSGVFLLDPTEYERLLAQPRRDGSPRTTVVGLFRTHARPGLLRPSLADKVLLSSKAGDASFLLLLIESSALRTAALFIGSKTQFPDEPAVPTFTFSESAFSALPEVSPETVAPSRKQRIRASTSSFAIVAVLLAIATVGFIGFLYWSNMHAEATTSPDLRVDGGETLTVHWNHASPEIQAAASGRLTISDGTRQTDVVLQADELRLGTINYVHSTQRVAAKLLLSMPNGGEIPLSAEWHP